jgi:hypothetical protein
MWWIAQGCRDMRRLAGLIVLALCATACRDLDVASQHVEPPPVCEVHGVAMHPEWVYVSTGESVYVMEYMETMRQHFPHHGGTVLSGERAYHYLLERRVRDFVCDECTKAYRAYGSEKPKQ